MINCEFQTYCGRALALAALVISLGLLTGCEDPGSYGDVEPIIYGRVPVQSSPTAPPMDDPSNDFWNEVVTGGIIVSDSAFVADTAVVDSQTILLQAVKSGNNLYLRARWADNRITSKRSYSQWNNPAVHLFTTTTTIDTNAVPHDTIVDTLVDAWYRRPYTVSATDTTWLMQDRFAIMWNAGDNGDEKADCRSMCHIPAEAAANGNRMYTTGGGHADVWHWQLATTDPALLAQDEWWSAEGRIPDAAIQKIYSNNYDTLLSRPVYMHQDIKNVFKPFLHASDTVAFDTTLVWLNNNILPAHIVHDDASGSIADVKAYSSFNRMTGWWTVLLKRSLTGGGPDDVNLEPYVANSDSIQVTAAFMNHNDAYHHGSRPFYIVFQ